MLFLTKFTLFPKRITCTGSTMKTLLPKNVDTRSSGRMRKVLMACMINLLFWKNEAFFFPLPFKSFYLHSRGYSDAINRQLSAIQSAHYDSEIPLLDGENFCDGRDMITHIKHLDRSAFELTGRGVYERMNITISDNPSDQDIYDKICKNERYVLISHGKQEDPIFNFGNAACLQAFARSWEVLTSMPSRLSVISKSQDEALRIKLIQNVTNLGYVDGEYRGFRVRGDGKFIKLTECCVWNCYDRDGEYIGQAALFDRELSPVVSKEYLDQLI